MKTSIIIPVYNVEAYLEECVASALKICADKEILLVDDGSTDKSGALCDALSEKYPEVRTIHQENGGLSAARNTGIRHSTGDFVMFVDSDDFLDPVQTDEMLSQLSPETQVAMGLYQNYYAREDKVEQESCEAFLQMSGVVPIEQFLRTIPEDGQSCYMIACRFLVNREFLLEHDLFFLKGIYHEDEEWTLRLMCFAGNVQVFHNYFYFYRQARAGAITSAVKAKHLNDGFQIISRAKDLLASQREDSAQAAYLRQRMSNLYMNNMIHVYLLSKEERLPVFQQLKQYRDSCIHGLAGTKGKIIRLCEKVLGMKLTCWLLHILQDLIKGGK